MVDSNLTIVWLLGQSVFQLFIHVFCLVYGSLVFFYIIELLWINWLPSDWCHDSACKACIPMKCLMILHVERAVISVFFQRGPAAFFQSNGAWRFWTFPLQEVRGVTLLFRSTRRTQQGSTGTALIYSKRRGVYKRTTKKYGITVVIHNGMVRAQVAGNNVGIVAGITGGSSGGPSPRSGTESRVWNNKR